MEPVALAERARPTQDPSLSCRTATRGAWHPVACRNIKCRKNVTGCLRWMGKGEPRSSAELRKRAAPDHLVQPGHADCVATRLCLSARQSRYRRDPMEGSDDSQGSGLPYIGKPTPRGHPGQTAATTQSLEISPGIKAVVGDDWLWQADTVFRPIRARGDRHAPRRRTDEDPNRRRPDERCRPAGARRRRNSPRGKPARLRAPRAGAPRRRCIR